VLDSVRHHRTVENQRAATGPGMVEADDSFAEKLVGSLQTAAIAV
jgi:hypothetical protein